MIFRLTSNAACRFKMRACPLSSPPRWPTHKWRPTKKRTSRPSLFSTTQDGPRCLHSRLILWHRMPMRRQVPEIGPCRHHSSPKDLGRTSIHLCQTGTAERPIGTSTRSLEAILVHNSTRKRSRSYHTGYRHTWLRARNRCRRTAASQHPANPPCLLRCLDPAHPPTRHRLLDPRKACRVTGATGRR